MQKKWFDQRAEYAKHWTIVTKHETSYDPNNWGHIERTWYVAAQLPDARWVDVDRFGKMTKEEAIAMAKLLNAVEGVQS